MNAPAQISLKITDMTPEVSAALANLFAVLSPSNAELITTSTSQLETMWLHEELVYEVADAICHGNHVSSTRSMAARAVTAFRIAAHLANSDREESAAFSGETRRIRLTRSGDHNVVNAADFVRAARDPRVISDLKANRKYAAFGEGAMRMSRQMADYLDEHYG